MGSRSRKAFGTAASTKAFGSSASLLTILATSTWSRERCNPSTTPLAPSLSPMRRLPPQRSDQYALFGILGMIVTGLAALSETVQPLDNPMGTRLSPMSWVRSVTWAGAELKDTTMISTGASVHLPTMRIWSKSRSIRSPYQGFSELATKVSEEMFQEFVNDWTASQNLP